MLSRTMMLPADLSPRAISLAPCPAPIWLLQLLGPLMAPPTPRSAHQPGMQDPQYLSLHLAQKETHDVSLDLEEIMTTGHQESDNPQYYRPAASRPPSLSSWTTCSLSCTSHGPGSPVPRAPCSSSKSPQIQARRPTPGRISQSLSPWSAPDKGLFNKKQLFQLD